MLRGLRGPATAVALGQPTYLATDATGNIYVSDFVYNVVLRMSTDGTMNLFAGTGAVAFNGEAGPATSRAHGRLQWRWQGRPDLIHIRAVTASLETTPAPASVPTGRPGSLSRKP